MKYRFLPRATALAAAVLFVPAVLADAAAAKRWIDTNSSRPRSPRTSS